MEGSTRWLVKLNLDAASCDNPGPRGCWGVFRDSSGAWLVGFSVKLGVCTSVKAELMALYTIWRSCKTKILRILLWTWTLSWLWTRWRSLHLGIKIQAYYFALKDCQALLKDSTLNCQLLHCYKGSNQAADALTNIGVTQDANLMLDDSLHLLYMVFLWSGLVTICYQLIKFSDLRL